MKDKQLFMQLSRCTGCQLCVMACSLNRVGSCGENGSHIKILLNPEFDYFMPVVNYDCLEANCLGECIKVCSPRVLKLADDQLSVKLRLHPKWEPVVLNSQRSQ